MRSPEGCLNARSFSGLRSYGTLSLSREITKYVRLLAMKLRCHVKAFEPSTVVKSRFRSVSSSKCLKTSSGLVNVFEMLSLYATGSTSATVDR